MLKNISLILALVVLLCNLNINSNALMVELTLDKLIEEAEVIVQGKVNKMWSSWDANHTTIFTYVILDMDDLLKGEGQPLNQLTFRFLGGEVEGIGMAESDMPNFEVGEEAILFLQKGKNKYYRLVGRFQAKFKIEKDKLTRKKIITQAGYSVVKRVEGRLVLDARMPGRIFLPDFKKVIRAIVREQFQKSNK